MRVGVEIEEEEIPTYLQPTLTKELISSFERHLNEPAHLRKLFGRVVLDGGYALNVQSTISVYILSERA
jgi:hypothetical protein